MEMNILMPVNEKFLEVFGIFMDDGQKNKIRANNVRQYMEGLIDLLLKDKIMKKVKANECYGSLNWKRKLKYIKEYDEKIGNNIAYIFKVGGDGSHFNGTVEPEELNTCIKIVTHIVEDIFVNYFCEEEHVFGTEDVLRVFSMLPLKHRIYIMEEVSKKYLNPSLVDRLSLAYFKYGDEDRAYSMLKRAFENKVIDQMFVELQLNKFEALNIALKEVQELNSDMDNNREYQNVILVGNQIVTGFPSSKDVFDTSKAVEYFGAWLKEKRENYPDFINLFFYLMQTDDRTYLE